MSRVPRQNRLGVFKDPNAKRIEDRYLYADPIASARVQFLETLRKLQPAVVEELLKIARVARRDDKRRVDELREEDEESLNAWSVRRHLTDSWCLDYARATMKMYRRYYASPSILSFNITLDTDVIARKVRSKPLTKKPEHFTLLAKYQLDPSLSGIGKSTSKSRAAVQISVKRLASEIGLTLRQAPKGNPKMIAAGKKASLRREAEQRPSRPTDFRFGIDKLIG